VTKAPLRRDRRAERHLETRERIVQTAWALARERGLAGWSLRDVAESVGMRAPSLYVYFDSKNAVYDAMFADGYRTLMARIAATSTEGAPAEVLRRAANLSFDFSVEDPARHQLLFLRTIAAFTPSAESYTLAQACSKSSPTCFVPPASAVQSRWICGPQCSPEWRASRSATTPAATGGTD